MLELPEYPWSQLAPYRALAESHPGGVCDLSIGAPADPTPQVIQEALTAASNSHGYPSSEGTARLRESIAAWYDRRRGVPGLGVNNVAITVGSKEFIAWLPTLLDMGPGDILVQPKVAYPTYDIGAKLCGAESVAADSLTELDEDTLNRVKLVWLNSPANPTGAVTEIDSMRETVQIARRIGAVVASDECYAELGWDRWDTEPVPCVLDPAVVDHDFTGVLSVYSLSKQSNMAGYRAAFYAGDPDLVTGLINLRKHAGMVVPGPVQQAMLAAINDDEHVAQQKDLYRARRKKLMAAVTGAGLEIQESVAGLYLWVKDPQVPEATAEASWELLRRLAQVGIIAGPGVFYSEAGNGFVRLSLTATDDTIDEGVKRLGAGI